MSYIDQPSRFEEAEAKVLTAVSYLVWIIPGMYFAILIMQLMGYNFGTIDVTDFTNVLINVIWAIIVLKILDLIGKQMEKNSNHGKPLDKHY